MNKHYINWLDSECYNVFGTITLRQAILSERGTWQPIMSEHVRKTAWIFRDRLTKRLLGKKKILPFLVFSEGSANDKRDHIHIVTVRPRGIPFSEYCDVFRQAALRLEWVYNEIDIREIEPRTQRRVISYSLKEGVGALIPEACCLH